jgi:hypothetical protein
MELELLLTRLNLYRTQQSLLTYLIRETGQKIAEVQAPSAKTNETAEPASPSEEHHTLETEQ